MTAHAHDPAAEELGPNARSATPGRPPITESRPRWLLPGLAVAIVAGALVVAGVVSLSTVMYAGLFGGMLLMHAGGHGHGGHGGGPASRSHGPHGGGDGGGSDRGNLSRHSSGAQAIETGSVAGLDQRVREDTMTSENDDHDQHRTHGCH